MVVFLTVVVFIIVLIQAVKFVIGVIGEYHRMHNEMLEKLTNSTLEMTPDSFERMRKRTLGRNREFEDFAGIYILHNKTNDKYYVGQSTTVFNRVNQHFKGRGNGDVYHHFRSGHEWGIRVLDIRKTNYSTLNELERHFISYYNAFNNGYNRTRGNSG